MILEINNDEQKTKAKEENLIVPGKIKSHVSECFVMESIRENYTDTHTHTRIVDN